jgi:hypothetical protein
MEESVLRLQTRWTLVAFLFVGLAATSVQIDGQQSRERVLIRATLPATEIEAAIARAGGTITHRFTKIDAIAAEIPTAAMRTLRSSLPAGSLTKDIDIAAPGAARDLADRTLQLDDAELASDDGMPLGEEAIAEIAQHNPAAYTVNNGLTRVSELHAGGIAGQGMIVGVIDSGIRPGFPHLTLDNSVIGCEDFVNDTNGCSHFANNGHGTFVAGMISANVTFTFGAASALRLGVLQHAPQAFSNPPANTSIPMLGSAPLSSIYAFRVFGPTGGAPTSRVLMAMERAILLREQFDAGAGGQDIQVVNMSIGGPTIYAGRDLLDSMLNEMIAADIVPVIAASNTGPALLTTGSPGSAFSALTVGAASLVHNERILRSLQFGVPTSLLYRPFNGHQTAYFSSRGPNADGRPDPDVMATGFANYGQGTGGTIGTVSLGSGTSYAAPSVAGVAAVLRQAFPDATALQVRNAIIASANPAIITDGSGPFDQGAGMVDALAAATLLASGNVSNSLEKPHNPKKKVEKNLSKFAGLNIHSGNVSLNSGLLLPGQQNSILYDVPEGTSQVLINVSNFQQTGPGNALFGDDIILAVHSAKTSSIGTGGDYSIFSFTNGGDFVVNNPEPGLMRVTLFGDWTNTDVVSVDATIASIAGSSTTHSAKGNLRDGDSDTFTVNVPAGTAKLEFLLQWQEDWSKYPGADLDLTLVNPSKVSMFTGATLNSPERVTVDKPAAGDWTVVVDAFEVHLPKANYTLTMMRDGVVVKLK